MAFRFLSVKKKDQKKTHLPSQFQKPWRNLPLSVPPHELSASINGRKNRRLETRKKSATAGLHETAENCPLMHVGEKSEHESSAPLYRKTRPKP
ncbi:uncharacterized protein J3R85_001764 [Psidium guajava]|nr:uncharacterized protein J3R85_001764 [Psidium guajava]